MKTITSQIQTITRDTLISDILVKNPDKAEIIVGIMIEFGIHCIGCGAAAFETLEQGVLGHGFSEKELDKLIFELNKVIGENSKSEKNKIEIKNFKLTLTKNAVEKVKSSFKKMKKNKTTALKISVLAGGCSGFMYSLDFLDKPSKGDLNFKQDGLNICVDKNSLEFLDGSKIDFVDSLNESGFKFNNPNTSKECGCGKSFK